MLAALTPDGDQVPETNDDSDGFGPHNLEGARLSELSAEQLGRHTKRADGSDFPVRPN